MLNFFSKKKSKKTNTASGESHSKAGHFHTLTVSDIRKETSDCVSVSFEIPENLKEDFLYVPGQNLTLKTTINGEDVRRSYSLCSSPLEGDLRVAIKQIPDGVFSTWANSALKVGDTLEVMTPTGGFVLPIENEDEKTFVGIAAGSGITPIMSMVKSVLESAPKSRFVLLYGNKNSNSIIFKEEIEALKNRYMTRFEVHHILSKEDQGSDLTFGRIDRNKLEIFSNKFFEVDKVDGFYICGPAEMTEIAKQTLTDLGVQKDHIHFELFVAGPAPKNAGAKTEKKSKEILSQVTVILDGEESHIEISSNGDTILDAALDANADVPFACKGAVCCTCRAKVLEGEVKMDMNYALEDEEVAEGYVLTCQSHPTTPKVVVSFDE